jgi:hypothetical protein
LTKEWGIGYEGKKKFTVEVMWRGGGRNGSSKGADGVVGV